MQCAQPDIPLSIPSPGRARGHRGADARLGLGSRGNPLATPRRLQIPKGGSESPPGVIPRLLPAPRHAAAPPYVMMQSARGVGNGHGGRGRWQAEWGGGGAGARRPFKAIAGCPLLPSARRAIQPAAKPGAPQPGEESAEPIIQGPFSILAGIPKGDPSPPKFAALQPRGLCSQWSPTVGAAWSSSGGCYWAPRL